MNAPIEIGKPVLWWGGFGMDRPRVAYVMDNTGEKNGERVYDLDNGHWAYEYQLQPLPQDLTIYK